MGPDPVFGKQCAKATRYELVDLLLSLPLKLCIVIHGLSLIFLWFLYENTGGKKTKKHWTLFLIHAFFSPFVKFFENVLEKYEGPIKMWPWPTNGSRPTVWETVSRGSQTFSCQGPPKVTLISPWTPIRNPVVVTLTLIVCLLFKNKNKNIEWGPCGTPSSRGGLRPPLCPGVVAQGIMAYVANHTPPPLPWGRRATLRTNAL